MNRSDRIFGIARLEERKEHEAARALAVSRQRLEEVEGRLAELRRYRDEYRERMRRDQRPDLTIADLKRHQLFMRRLEDGIGQTESSAARARDEWRVRETAWRHQRSRVEALERVAERHQTNERRGRERRLERANDDRASHASSTRPDLR